MRKMVAFEAFPLRIESKSTIKIKVGAKRGVN
jgi:hypothetical protein